MKILIIYFLVVIPCLIAQGIQCPNYCYCYKWRNMIRTDCVKKNMYNTFLAFSHKTEVLDLSYNVISILHGNEFQDANLRQLKDLRLSNNRLHEIDKYSFNGLEFLENVDLSYNYIEHISPDIFKYNSNLKVFNISNNPLRLKANEVFLSNVPSLKVLNMARCYLEYVSVRLFHNLEQLQVLNISHNYIKKIHPEDLEMMKHLKYVDFSNDNLHHFNNSKKTAVGLINEKLYEKWQNLWDSSQKNTKTYRNDLTCNDISMILFQWLMDQKILFHPFCQAKSQKMTETEPLDTNYLKEPHQINLNHKWNATQIVSEEDNNIFVDVLQFFQSIPSYYAILCGIQVGLVIGAISTYFCMRKVTRIPPASLGDTSSDDERTSLAERSRIIANNSGNMTFALISLNTPPGTPPSPYHSRLTLPSTFSLPN